MLARTLAALLLALAALGAGAQPSGRADVYLFWAAGCPHCRDEIEFLKRLEGEEPRLRVLYLEVSSNEANQVAFAALVERIALEQPAVPLTVVGDAVLVGYAEVTGVTTRYVRFSHLAGGLVLLALGALLLLRPELLMFG